MNTQPETLAAEDVPPLSDHYHHARRNLTLVSAIVLFWEFVGIELGKTAKMPGDIPITIKHPAVVPLVLLALLIFFFVRLILEWQQSDPVRKNMVAAQFDYRLSCALAFAAVALFAWQKLYGVDLVDSLPNDSPLALALALAPILITTILYFWIFYNKILIDRHGYNSKYMKLTFKFRFISMIVILIYTVYFWIFSGRLDIYLLFAIIITLFFIVHSIFSLRFYRWILRKQHDQGVA